MRKTLICEVCVTRKRINSDEEFSREVLKHQKKYHPKLDFKSEESSSKERRTKDLGPAQLHLFSAKIKSFP